MADFFDLLVYNQLNHSNKQKIYCLTNETFKKANVSSLDHIARIREKHSNTKAFDLYADDWLCGLL